MPYLYRPRMLRHAKLPLSDKTLQTLSDFDAVMALPESAREQGFERLRRTLKSIPRKERGVEYTDRFVILYALFRMKNVRAGSLAAQIRTFYQKQGLTTELDDFTHRLHAVLGGKTGLTNLGYGVLFEDLDTALLCQDLVDFYASIAPLGLPVFINSGTLLGAVREGTFIGHDDDVDLAVVLPASNQVEMFLRFREFYQALTEIGIGGLKPFYSAQTLVIKLETPNGLHVDIFPACIEEGRVYVWPHTCGELDESDVLPLSTAKLYGHDFPAPAEPEKMLVLNYGPGWQTPDSGFVFKWKAARKKFTPALSHYRKARRINLFKRALGLSDDT